MTFLRRLRAWLYRRFHHRDQTWIYAWPWVRKEGEPWTYCHALGHKWGGWRRDSLGPFYSRRCRRRRCAAVQVATEKVLDENNAFYRGGKIWGRR